MDALTVNAYAKINLTLDVLKRRDDGYHEVDMLMQTISLHDTLTFSPADGLALRIQGSVEHILSPEDLVLKAARLLQAYTGCAKGADIVLTKRIPIRAGLGGGSADAAATLTALNRLWELGLAMDELSTLAAKLGADVPFCLQGGLKRATGLGTVLAEVEGGLPEDTAIVVVKPCEGLSTPFIYGQWDCSPAFAPEGKGTVRALEALKHRDADGLFDALYNALEAPAAAQEPQIAQAIQALLEHGARAARMSGSGSAVFGLFTTRAKAEEAAAEMRKRFGFGECCEAIREA